jgi:hypothetical protein
LHPGNGMSKIFASVCGAGHFHQFSRHMISRDSTPAYFATALLNLMSVAGIITSKNVQVKMRMQESFIANLILQSISSTTTEERN